MVDFACLYQGFDPAVPLEPDDPTYVDWQRELGLTDVKTQLTNSVLLTPNKSIQRLFTGHRGGGKTTELKRVMARLRMNAVGPRYFVSFVDADDAVDLDDIDPTDLVLAIVRQLVSDIRSEPGVEIRLKSGRKFQAFLEGARDALKAVPDAGIDLKAGDPWGVVELSTALKRQPSIRREVRRLLEGRLPTLYDAINDELLPELEGKLATKGYAGVVVIVDQLDRLPAKGDHHRTLFFEGRGKLRALNCHIVYTVPIEYAFSRATVELEQEYGAVLGLPLLPVSAPERAVREAARECARRVVTTRMDQCGVGLDQLFDMPRALDTLIHLSGGHFRSLFLLLRTIIDTSDLAAPLTERHIDHVTRMLAARYVEALEAPERALVRLVHDTKAKPENVDQLEDFYELLRDQYVFAYTVGDKRWYDWYPLLERSSLGTP